MIFGHHPRQGLYDPQFEHDACGVAFVATMTGVASHKAVSYTHLTLPTKA